MPLLSLLKATPAAGRSPGPSQTRACRTTSRGQAPQRYVTSFRLERPIVSRSAWHLLQGRYKRSWVHWQVRRYRSPTRTSRVTTRSASSPDRTRGRVPHDAWHDAPLSQWQMLIYQLGRKGWMDAVERRAVMGGNNGRYYSSRMCGSRSSESQVTRARVGSGNWSYSGRGGTKYKCSRALRATLDGRCVRRPKQRLRLKQW